jgi:hypothetical protein
VSLSALRMHEEELQQQLRGVQAALAEAVLAVQAAGRAESDLAALRERATGQGAYRDVAAERKQHLHSVIEAGEAAKDKRQRLRRREAILLDELEKTRLDIERAGVRRSVLPALEGIPAARPCGLRWDQMQGDGDARVCPRCKAQVLDLALLEPAEAERLLALTPGTSLHRRADGTILTRDCAGAPSPPVGRWLLYAAVLGVAGLAAAAYKMAGQSVVGRGSDEDYGAFMPRPGTTPPDEVSRPVGDDDASQIEAARLHNATTLTISDTFESLGGRYATNVTMQRKGKEFSYTLQCGNGKRSLSQIGRIPAAFPEAFLDSIDARPVGHTLAQCTHTDDYPKIHVEVTMPTPNSVALSVSDCSYQWYRNGEPLSLEGRASTTRKQHPRINEAYEALLDAMGGKDCYAAVDKAKNCVPPYVKDAQGHKHWIPECLR